MRKLTPSIISGFVNAFLRRGFDEPVPIPDVHLEWWGLFCKPDKYVAIAAPRGHAKSTALTISFGTANVCFRVHDHVMIISDTESQAKQFLNDIKKEFIENQDLIDTFQVERMVKNAETEFIVQFKDGAQARLIARGSEQKPRGMLWRGKRPNLILCDDLENDEIVDNNDRRVTFRHRFYDALLNSGSKSCKVRVVGTILHQDSLLARLMPQITDKGLQSSPLKVWTTTKRAWLSILYRAHPDDDDFSHILWPDMWPLERLQLERQKYVEDGYPEGYAQEYLNKPISEKDAYFRKQDIVPIPVTEFGRNAEPEQYYVGVDMAISEKDKRAFTVFVVAGYSSTGILRIRDIRRFRGDGYTIVNEIFSIQQWCKAKSPNYEPLFLIEQENIARSLGSFLDREQVKRNVFIDYDEMQPIRDKELRARAIQARFRAGGIEVDTTAEWYDDFINELLYFPKSEYADQVDALAWVGIALGKMIEPHSRDEQEDMDWDEEFQLTIEDDYDMGQSDVTGY